jgi:hypothetical protein
MLSLMFCSRGVENSLVSYCRGFNEFLISPRQNSPNQGSWLEVCWVCKALKSSIGWYKVESAEIVTAIFGDDFTR